MTDIKDFLLDRIAEDEDVANQTKNRPIDTWAARGLPKNSLVYFAVPDFNDRVKLGMIHPSRIIAECEARRKILDMEPDEEGYVTYGREESCSDSCPPAIVSYVFRLLAAVYKDHPEYQKEWAL